MKFTINKKFILAKVEEKEKVNLYTLVDNDNYEKMTAIGVKSESKIEERSLVEAEVSIRTQSERFELKNNEKKYVEVASFFVSSIQKVK
ncbi:MULTISPECIES: hypothetical protein [Bacillus cereus group]|uniref:Uncharacterized protein n=1 Tax=Bacillus cereus TaxID=1396 RepID=A0A164MGT8_BACCE|nr:MULTISPECIES: hypothetical protein [Bacillus cereus group]KZD59379.1 hypothetical protein B4088_4161 [Bacillus cereus]OJE20651.1 hypothetical protein BAQ46_22775 [Bacillus paranthracis]